MDRRETLRTIAILAIGIFCDPLAGCRKSSREARTALFSASDQALIAQIAETILPENDTPGAKTSGVDLFVVRALNDCYSSGDRKQFIRDLRAFEERCFSHFGRSFIRCTPAQQLSMVEELDREALGLWGRIRSKIFRELNFFGTLKRLCVIGIALPAKALRRPFPTIRSRGNGPVAVRWSPDKKDGRLNRRGSWILH
jgi:hypothetical protein